MYKNISLLKWNIILLRIQLRYRPVFSLGSQCWNCLPTAFARQYVRGGDNSKNTRVSLSPWIFNSVTCQHEKVFCLLPVLQTNSVRLCPFSLNALCFLAFCKVRSLFKFLKYFFTRIFLWDGLHFFMLYVRDPLYGFYTSK